MRDVIHAMAVVCLLFLSACAITPLAKYHGPRTIILSGKEFKEADLGEFITWWCTDFVSPKGVLVEVGTFTDPSLNGYGFVLYDGGNSGDVADYQRRGVNHRWDWGPSGSEYAFIIKPDGTGLFFDFSMGENGAPTKANDVYKCYKR